MSDEIYNDLAFSYRVFLLPQLANRESGSDLAVQFVKYDPNDPEQLEQYRQVVVLLKPAVTQVTNQGNLKAGDVCRFVEPIVKSVVGEIAKFNASYHHTAACRFYQIRPPKTAEDQTKTKTQYCHYDEAHKDHVYTDAWKNFLIQEMNKLGQYEKIVDKYKNMLRGNKCGETSCDM